MSVGTWRSCQQDHASDVRSYLAQRLEASGLGVLEAGGFVDYYRVERPAHLAVDQPLYVVSVYYVDVRGRGECLDANNGQWYGPYLQSALDSGLIPEPMVAGYKEEVKYELDENGNATSSKVIYQGAFNGELPITREEMAVLTQYVYQYTRTILTNKPVKENKKQTFTDTDKISDWAKTSVVQAVANGFMDGMDNNLFNPGYTATRAQAATVILRVLNKIGE